MKLFGMILTTKEQYERDKCQAVIQALYRRVEVKRMLSSHKEELRPRWRIDKCGKVWHTPRRWRCPLCYKWNKKKRYECKRCSWWHDCESYCS